MSGAFETIDHRLDAISTANSATGEAVQLFVREKRPTDAAKAPVVLFVHGGTYPAVRDAVWSLLMEIDPVGASWQPPVARSPAMSMEGINRGWNKPMAARITAPSLLITMEWNVHIVPATVRELFDDLTVTDKVFATVGGTSHYMPWERDCAILHELSASWLSDGSAGGLRRGTLDIDPRL